MYYEEKYEPEQILIYLRKSRSDDPLLSLEEVLQKHEAMLMDWASRNLDSPIPESNIYREVVSGETIDGRPEVQKLLQRIENPRIKAVLIVEVQRLSRGDLEDCGRIMKLFRYTNTKVITPMKTYDLSDEYDRDAFERELKRGNDYLEYYKKIQNRGKLLSAKDGNYIGSVAPYGYEKIILKDGRKDIPTLKIKESEAEIVRLIFDMYSNQGIGLVNIANKLNEMKVQAPKGDYWTYSTLTGIIQNVHYIGKIKWNARKNVSVVKDQEVRTTRPKNKEYFIFEGKHPAIIEEELFQRVQDIKKKSARLSYKERPLVNPLASLLYCECGSVMQLRTYKQANGQRSAPRFACRNQTICNNGSVLYEELIQNLCDILEEHVDNFRICMKRDGSAAKEKQKQNYELLKKRLQELEQKEVSLWDKYAEEGMPKDIFEKLRDKVLSEKEEITTTLKNMVEHPIIDYSEHIITFSYAIELLQDTTASMETKNAFLKTCINRITYKRERPKREHNGLTTVKGWSSPAFELDIQFKL